MPLSTLNGVNLDRNFDYEWSEVKNCSAEYAGFRPFSESETQAVLGLYAEKRPFSLVLDFDGDENEYLFPNSHKSQADLRALGSLARSAAFADSVEVGSGLGLRNRTRKAGFIDWAYLQGGFAYQVGLKYQPKASLGDLKLLFDRHWSAFKTVLDYMSPLYAE